MKILLVVILSLGLAGCCTPVKEIEYVDRPVPVHVPVYIQPPEPVIQYEPPLAISMLTEADISSPDKVAKAYWKSILILRTYANILQCQLDAYRVELEKQCKSDEDD